MRNPFRGGLVEKIIRVEEELPDYLAKAIDQLRRFPNSKRVINETLAVAKFELKRNACPVPLITKRAVVVYEGSSSSGEVGIEYRKEKTIPTNNGKNHNDSYRFYVFNKDEPDLYEICVSRENRGLKMIPIGVEFFNSNERVLDSYEVNGGSELAIMKNEDN